jgi:hypothetical protein
MSVEIHFKKVTSDGEFTKLSLPISTADQCRKACLLCPEDIQIILSLILIDAGRPSRDLLAFARRASARGPGSAVCCGQLWSTSGGVQPSS